MTEPSSPFAFSPKLKEIIATRLWTSRTGEKHEAGAASTPNNLWVLRGLLQQERPVETLEIGLCHGISALLITQTQKELGTASFRHTAIDPFQAQVWKNEGCALLEEEGMSECFRLLEDFSSLALAQLVRDGERFGLIYVDGSHLFEDVFVDAYFSTQLLSEGGLMLFDDSADPHVAKVLRFLESNYAGILEPFDLGPYQLPDRPWMKRLANKLGYRQLTAFRKTGDPPREWDAPFKSF